METIALVLLATPMAVYPGYLCVLIVAASLSRRRPPPLPAPLPSVSILVCAHNEAASIGAKLDSVVDAVAHWLGEAEILVADDGSADDTAAIVAGFADSGVRLIRLPRGGKAAALDEIAGIAARDVLVMTDADPLFDRGTLPALVAPFADPRVGAVAGTVAMQRNGPSGARRGGRFAGADIAFRWYESTIRRAEDRLFGCVSADGGIYAIRRALMPRVRAGVTDDFWISTAAVAAGRRIAFAPDARVYEASIGGDRQQFRRRVRITVRGLTGLWHRRALMNPWRTGWYAPALFMHKVARRLAPLAFVPLLPLSGVLASRGSLAWTLVFAGLAGACALGIVGYRLRPALPRPLAMAYGTVLHLAGLGTGVVLFLSGRRYVQWTPDKAAEPAR